MLPTSGERADEAAEEFQAWLAGEQARVLAAVGRLDPLLEYSDVLSWAELHCRLRVSWDDADHAWWLHWAYGGVRLGGILRDNGSRARKMAAVFVMLWACGVPAMLASDLVRTYSLYGPPV